MKIKEKNKRKIDNDNDNTNDSGDRFSQHEHFRNLSPKKQKSNSFVEKCVKKKHKNDLIQFGEVQSDRKCDPVIEIRVYG